MECSLLVEKLWRRHPREMQQVCAYIEWFRQGCSRSFSMVPLSLPHMLWMLSFRMRFANARMRQEVDYLQAPPACLLHLV